MKPETPGVPLALLRTAIACRNVLSIFLLSISLKRGGLQLDCCNDKWDEDKQFILSEFWGCKSAVNVSTRWLHSGSWLLSSGGCRLSSLSCDSLTPASASVSSRSSVVSASSVTVVFSSSSLNVPLWQLPAGLQCRRQVWKSKLKLPAGPPLVSASPSLCSQVGNGWAAPASVLTHTGPVSWEYLSFFLFLTSFPSLGPSPQWGLACSPQRTGG